MVRSPASPIPGSYKGALFLMWARPIPSKARQRCTAHRQIAAPHTTARMQLLAPHATARTGRSRLLTQQHACLAQAVLSLPFLPFATAQHACSGQGASITHARTHICTQAHTHTHRYTQTRAASITLTHTRKLHAHTPQSAHLHHGIAARLGRQQAVAQARACRGRASGATAVC